MLKNFHTKFNIKVTLMTLSLLISASQIKAMEEKEVTECPYYFGGHKDHTPLHLACTTIKSPPLEKIKSLVESYDVNARDSKGFTALHCAADLNHVDIIQFLLTVQNVNKNPLTSRGSTMCHLAACNKNIETLKFLQSESYNLSQTDTDGNTALHRACESHSKTPEDTRFFNTVKLLVQADISIDARNYEKQTPLHRLVAANQGIHANDLLSFNADIEARDKNGKTPLFYAIRSGLRPAIQRLCELEANVRATDNNDRTIWHECGTMKVSPGYEIDVRKTMAYLFSLKDTPDIGTPDCEGKTPLCKAAMEKNFHVMAFLIANGANTEEASNYIDSTVIDSTVIEKLKELIFGPKEDENIWELCKLFYPVTESWELCQPEQTYERTKARTKALLATIRSLK